METQDKDIMVGISPELYQQSRLLLLRKTFLSGSTSKKSSRELCLVRQVPHKSKGVL